MQPTVFMCHSSADKPFVRRLTRRLTNSGVSLWLDEAELKVGESLLRKLAGAISSCEFLVAVISSTSVESPWVQIELDIAMTREVSGKRLVVLPVKIDTCQLPTYLLHKLYADFNSPLALEAELRKLLKALNSSPKHTCDSSLMYTNREGWKVLMVQTFADRAEWGGPSYHIVNPCRSLKRILKLFGRRLHPVPEPEATECIDNCVNSIMELDPDILGFGGKGRRAEQLSSDLQAAGYNGEVGYWGADVGNDAGAFLREHKVSEDQW